MLIEVYCLNKYFITEIVEEKVLQQHTILDKLNLMDRKFEALVKAISTLTS
jgi:hypothetical protein